MRTEVRPIDHRHRRPDNSRRMAMNGDLSHRGATTVNKFEELKDFVAGLEDDFEKFYDKGNKAAGVRVRKSMQQLKALAQDIRVDVQEKVRARTDS